MKRIKLSLSSIAVAAAMLLTGCAVHNAAISGAGAPFYLAYDSEEVIREQAKVATITSTGGLVINDVVVNANNMRAANSSVMKKQTVVADVFPGEYSIRITHDPSGNPVSMNAITYNFEAGSIYDVAIQIVKVVVKENSSPQVAQKIAARRKTETFEKQK